MITKAVIVAAGKGTRMRELTKEMPKPMLPVRGKPILEHIVAGLKDAGITDLCIITGWHGEIIEQHFGDGSSFGLNVSYIRQEVQDGTGSAVGLAKDFVGNDHFMMGYGDILVEPHTYANAFARFKESGADGLVSVLKDTVHQSGFGLFLFDQAFMLTHLIEKPSAEELEQVKRDGWMKEGDPFWYNAGIFVFPPQIFETIARLTPSPRGEYELTDAILALLMGGTRFAGFHLEGTWADVRDPEILAELQ